MAEVTEKRCDYVTSKVACLKRKSVQRYEVLVGIPASNQPYVVYSGDLCPHHAKVLIAGIVKVMGSPEPAK